MLLQSGGQVKMPVKYVGSSSSPQNTYATLFSLSGTGVLEFLKVKLSQVGGSFGPSTNRYFNIKVTVDGTKIYEYILDYNSSSDITIEHDYILGHLDNTNTYIIQPSTTSDKMNMPSLSIPYTENILVEYRTTSNSIGCTYDSSYIAIVRAN